MSNTDEIGSQNRTFRTILILTCLTILPALLLTEYSLEMIQQKVIGKNYDKPWAPDAQKWLAHAYGYTLRPEKAAERYDWAGRLYADRRDFTTAGEMFYHQACELEAANRKYDALPVYERLEADYKDYPVGAKAHGAIVRLKTMSRP